MSDMLALVAAFALSAGAVALLLRHARRLPHARPDARGLHDRPVPRVGGLAVLAGALPVAWLHPPLVPGPTLVWLACLVAIALVSLVDDAHSVPVVARLGLHLAAAATVAWLAFGAHPVAVLAALTIAWSTNLYNFMDGSDGIAGTMTVTGFSAYAAAAFHAGAPWTAYAAIAVAALPFLAANRPTASLFLGDVGAVPLGFAAGALGVAGVASGLWDDWFPLLAFLPFVADATVTLAWRGLRRERVWEPHRSHFYQRLNLAGAGHRGTLAVYTALMLACGALAVACAVLRPAAGWLALAAAAAVHAGLFLLIVYHERKNARGSG